MAVATATAEGIRRVAEAIKLPGGYEAVQLRVAEQYIGQFGELAKKSNTLVLPANVADVGSMIALAMKAIGERSYRRRGSTWNDWVSPTGVNLLAVQPPNRGTMNGQLEPAGRGGGPPRPPEPGTVSCAIAAGATAPPCVAVPPRPAGRRRSVFTDGGSPRRSHATRFTPDPSIGRSRRRTCRPASSAIVRTSFASLRGRRPTL